MGAGACEKCGEGCSYMDDNGLGECCSPSFDVDYIYDRYRDEEMLKEHDPPADWVTTIDG